MLILLLIVILKIRRRGQVNLTLILAFNLTEQRATKTDPRRGLRRVEELRRTKDLIRVKVLRLVKRRVKKI